MFVSLFVSVAVTFGFKWKVSIHTTVAAGAAVVLVVDHGPWLALSGLAVAVVAWSRVAFGDHTAGQVIGGTITGATVGGSIYWALLSAL